jgi:deazaflavin-dependent oxidoreductase (nitroreductase family)
VTYRRTPVRRVINVVQTVLIRLALPPAHRFLLTVPGRISGVGRTTPVTVVHDRTGLLWLVAPYGEVEWVRNARASGVVVLSRGRRRAAWHVDPARPDEAARVLRAYLALEPITRPFFAARAEDGDASFRAEADRHPVFRLAPA